jgi:hypothetical protein
MTYGETESQENKRKSGSCKNTQITKERMTSKMLPMAILRLLHHKLRRIHLQHRIQIYHLLPRSNVKVPSSSASIRCHLALRQRQHQLKRQIVEITVHRTKIAALDMAMDDGTNRETMQSSNL